MRGLDTPFEHVADGFLGSLLLNIAGDTQGILWLSGCQQGKGQGFISNALRRLLIASSVFFCAS